MYALEWKITRGAISNNCNCGYNAAGSPVGLQSLDTHPYGHMTLLICLWRTTTARETRWNLTDQQWSGYNIEGKHSLKLMISQGVVLPILYSIWEKVICAWIAGVSDQRIIWFGLNILANQRSPSHIKWEPMKIVLFLDAHDGTLYWPCDFSKMSLTGKHFVNTLPLWSGLAPTKPFNPWKEDAIMHPSSSTHSRLMLSTSPIIPNDNVHHASIGTVVWLLFVAVDIIMIYGVRSSGIQIDIVPLQEANLGARWVIRCRKSALYLNL